METLRTLSIATDSPFQLRESSCCWIYALYNYGSWNLFTYIDVGTRSDTGKPNSSPATTVLPFIR
ncbi:hypothetical protein GN956_G27165, partial [Arapaima gigas]